MIDGIRFVRIFVVDFEASLDFYSGVLGLEVAALNETGSHFALFRTGQATLILEPVDPEDLEERDLTGRFAGISLGVRDIWEVYRHLKAQGVTFLSEPQVQPWGGTLADFLDPSANTLTLVQLRPAPHADDAAT